VQWQAASSLVHLALERGETNGGRWARRDSLLVADRIDIADRRVPRLIEHLVAVCADGYPGGSDGGAGGGGSAVEAAVGARERIVGHATMLGSLTGRVAVAAHLGASGEMWSPSACLAHLEDVLGLCDAYERPRPEDKLRLTCTGGVGMPNAILWGDPTCANIADPRCAGLCRQCYDANRYCARMLDQGKPYTRRLARSA
jgi:hypothetical protein